MKLQGYYSTGQFAKMADVSVRTIRFYDRQGVLHPSYVNENGARFYTDEDLALLQQILLLKYLGFSLEDIRAMTVQGSDSSHLISSLRMQEKLLQDQIEQLQSVLEAIHETENELQNAAGTGLEGMDWEKMLRLIHLTGMEHSLASQYQNASNLSARIALHSLYSTNPEGWFPWLFSRLDLQKGMKVLEVGCGDGALWMQNRARIPSGLSILLSDRSDGMVRDIRRSLEGLGEDFSFETADCTDLPHPSASFDLVIANHVLFYVKDLPAALQEIRRVLKPGGRFVCTTYSAAHMHEITDLVQEFDSHIVLSADRLYEQFGLDSGTDILKTVFQDVRMERYPDSLEVTQADPLIEYILSCHGSQNQYIVPRYKEFRAFVEEKTERGFHVTKDAGLFLCR